MIDSLHSSILHRWDSKEFLNVSTFRYHYLTNEYHPKWDIVGLFVGYPFPISLFYEPKDYINYEGQSSLYYRGDQLCLQF